VPPETPTTTINAPPPPPWPWLSVHEAGAGWVVIEKPAGLRSVPGRGDGKADSIETRARVVFPRADGPIMVHRLDLETSGLMVIALDRPRHRTLSRQFMHRKVGKDYVALLEGRMDGEEAAVDRPLTLDWDHRPRQKVDEVEGRRARTLFRVRRRLDDPPRTLVDVRPITGRTHQIRLHAALGRGDGGLGLPIVGDVLYGGPKAAAAARLMLHAERLAFFEPTDGRWLKFVSPAPFAEHASGAS